MPTYVLSGPGARTRHLAEMLYPKPYHWHLSYTDKIPVPKKEYTVILFSGWQLCPLLNTPSFDRFLLDARLIDTNSLSSLSDTFLNRPCLFCAHLPFSPSISILRSSTGWLFLCSTCISTYAIHGLPELPDMLFTRLYPTHSHTFPVLGEEPLANPDPGDDLG